MLTVTEVLALAVMERNAPTVVAGEAHLSMPVRWAHTSDMTFPIQAPQPERLILTTGAGIPDDRPRIDKLFETLSQTGASGVVILLGPRYSEPLPRSLLRAAERNQIPLVSLQPPGYLDSIAEAVNRIIFDRQLDLLLTSDRVHRLFTELAVEGASPWEIVREIARTTGRPVVLENLAHQMLAYDPAHQDPSHLLASWEEQSRRVTTVGRAGHDPTYGWLTAIVGARGKDWGRLILLPVRPRSTPSSPMDAEASSEFCSLVLQRGTEALALNQLIGFSDGYTERQTHAELLKGIITHSLTAREVALRAGAMGLPLERTSLVGIALRLRNPHRVSKTDIHALEELAVSALQRDHVPALTASLGNGVVGILVALNHKGDAAASLDEISSRLHNMARESFPDRLSGKNATGSEVIIAVGSPAGSIREARHTLSAALQTVGVALQADSSGHAKHSPLYFRPRDLRLTGLLRLLQDDSRIQSYIENEIGPLLEYDARHGTRLTWVLACYLDNGRNKTAAADAAHISRPSLYDRLERIERILRVDLNDPHSCLSLQVAIQAMDVVRQQGTS
ncbi:PucR family transcriptional regulator [Streptomyces sp. 1222.5]|uniref:PucR family transcriptional regulator n=1 Tax=Streptomyces sp. 1222.5 TaxID=1881026 RepID=UPI003EBA80B4